MVEQDFSCTASEQKTIERILEDDHAAVNHMILPKGDRLPEHHANSNVYMIVARGTVTLRLDDQPAHAYHGPCVLTIPYKTLMNVGNEHESTLELFVVKAPGPARMNG